MANEQYTHGHHQSVLRSHSSRTAQNSCAYLLPSLKPDMHVLDIGCGPGTITLDLAKLVPQGHATGVEPSSEDTLQKARDDAVQAGVNNITYALADAHALHFPDASFDVVHAHQVLQHVAEPIKALREMIRVTKQGGFVAVRETDLDAMTWFPANDGVKLWHTTHDKVGRSNGGEPNAGRRLLSWALQAGLKREQVTATASTWCYTTPEELAWFSESWAERVVSSSFAESALERGFVTQEGLYSMSQGWRDWGAQADAWFTMLHGEILCKV
ncbi:S-adenosyl-L-methionine-dependent methyltransferase [Roridomyces roridus]|uniref:S-adenosyl-L-methionine-dependent methyltransferase n=1 Tax=Roridomyces roridus TaxID=1738132 RepID=A0AAD7FBD0_9AGAR|nr:S-adenosyl-L-methionine-dependent methyltransferase [Roridomyces roridus]